MVLDRKDEARAQLQAVGEPGPQRQPVAAPEPSRNGLPQGVRAGRHRIRRQPIEVRGQRVRGAVAAPVGREAAVAAQRTGVERVTHVGPDASFGGRVRARAHVARPVARLGREPRGELLGDVFGERGVHARSAVGVAVLPLGAPVEIELAEALGER